MRLIGRVKANDKYMGVPGEEMVFKVIRLDVIFHGGGKASKTDQEEMVTEGGGNQARMVSLMSGEEDEKGHSGYLCQILLKGSVRKERGDDQIQQRGVTLMASARREETWRRTGSSGVESEHMAP